MGQEAYTQQHSKKTEAKAISFDGNLVISEPSLDVLFEQQRAIVTPAASHADEKAQPGIYILEPFPGAKAGMRIH